MEGKTPGNYRIIKRVGNFDKQTPLIILIPLLILLLIVVAFADTPDEKEYYIKIDGNLGTKIQNRVLRG